MDMEDDSDSEVDKLIKEVEVKEIRSLPKGDKLYQSVKADILQREKQRGKGTSRVSRTVKKL